MLRLQTFGGCSLERDGVRLDTASAYRKGLALLAVLQRTFRFAQRNRRGRAAVNVDAPGEDGHVVVDFNKAYNPPCAFNEYTTCPLPLKENILALKVLAIAGSGTLDTELRERARRGEGCLVKSYAWGPWEGGMVRGPVRKAKYSRAIAALPISRMVASSSAAAKANRNFWPTRHPSPKNSPAANIAMTPSLPCSETTVSWILPA